MSVPWLLGMRRTANRECFENGTRVGQLSLGRRAFRHDGGCTNCGRYPDPERRRRHKSGRNARLSIFNNRSFLVVPIPVLNPAIGAGGTLVAAMLFKTDELSKSSMIGGAGFYTATAVGAQARDVARFFRRPVSCEGQRRICECFLRILRYRERGRRIGSAHCSDPKRLFGQSIRAAPVAETCISEPNFAISISVRRSVRPSFWPPSGRDRSAFETREHGDDIRIVGTFDTRNMDFAPNAGELIEGKSISTSFMPLARETIFAWQ